MSPNIFMTNTLVTKTLLWNLNLTQQNEIKFPSKPNVLAFSVTQMKTAASTGKNRHRITKYQEFLSYFSEL